MTHTFDFKIILNRSDSILGIEEMSHMANAAESVKTPYGIIKIFAQIRF